MPKSDASKKKEDRSEIENQEIKPYNIAAQQQCGYKPEENLTASNAKRRSSSFHPYLLVLNNDPSILLALYASTSSMSLCHAENPYLKALLSMIPGFEVLSRCSLADLVAKECESTMSTVRERIRQSSAEISTFCDIATTKTSILKTMPALPNNRREPLKTTRSFTPINARLNVEEELRRRIRIPKGKKWHVITHKSMSKNTPLEIPKATTPEGKFEEIIMP
uniref:Uncharacterized protein n=1 Tax=Ditylenchus dipsaci TaxID=166011 RepID=A0A915EKI4_9BILA